MNNPLCGEIGSTYVYGPQKGVTENQKKKLDEAMAHFAQITSQALGTDYCNTPGAGAAGGLGFAFLSYLGATLTPGIELILNAVGLEQELSDADVVVTGEGRLDFQTAMGKRPLVGVANWQKKHHARLSHLPEVSQRKPPPAIKRELMLFSQFYEMSAHLRRLWILHCKKHMTATAEQVFRLL